MRIAYLDCFSGISGDMFLGAAVDAGVPFETLAAAASSLGLETLLACRHTLRAGLAATKIDVIIHGRPDQPSDLATADSHQHEPHEHGHSHAEAPPGSHSHSHSHAHRGLAEIRPILARAPISPAARDFALRAFELLAEAEAKIHNTDPESIHFHEVGSEDAIVDIVCAAVAVEAIAAEQWYCSALNVGSGTVESAHGTLPVPAPAAAELLRGAPIYSSGVAKELLTPTGAAILRTLNVRFAPLPRIALTATGYGAGARDFPSAANVVRLLIGESAEQAATNDTIAVLEANLDDMNPQLFSYVQQKLLSSGALDAFGVPVLMKKGRPGLVFTVLCSLADAEPLGRILLTETTTLGVRIRHEQRRTLQREHVAVRTAWGPVRIKLGRLHGSVVNCAPEYEDCRGLAEAHGVPLKTVMQEALRLYLASAGESAGSASHTACTDAREPLSSRSRDPL